VTKMNPGREEKDINGHVISIPSRTTWGSVTPSNSRLTPGYMAGILCRGRTQYTQ
jgi:hypothetical protein